MSGIADRAWLSPFLAISFLMVASTGIILMFHVRIFPVMIVHEFMSFFFCVAGVLHTWANRKPLFGYLRQRKAKVSLAAGIVMGLIFVSMAMGHASDHEMETAQSAHSTVSPRAARSRANPRLPSASGTPVPATAQAPD